MNVGLKVAAFFGEIALIGIFLYLFTQVMDWISPSFVVYHYEAYVLAGFIWSAIPAIVLFGLIIKYARKDDPPTYTGGYY